jgi:hypothetical protein
MSVGNRDGRDDDEQRISKSVLDIARRRAVIDQVKGVLMFVYGIDADAAFGLLQWQSQQHNVKLRLLAEQVLKDFAALPSSVTALARVAAGNLLLTAHERIDKRPPSDW